jgi:hypothetical protein
LKERVAGPEVGKKGVDTYNDNHNLGAPMTLDLFIADDVAEQMIMRRNSGGASYDELGDDRDEPEDP